ncbi:MAG: PH domain-containing protein [Pseudomonadota bacterium]
MGYVEKSLASDETVRKKARFHWSYHFFAWASLIVLGVIIIGVVIFVRMMIWMKTTEIAVTDRRLVIKRGWLSRSTEELSLNSVEEVNVRQGFWGRFLGFGQLKISGTGAGDLATPNIADPVGFRTAISDARSRFLPAKA